MKVMTVLGTRPEIIRLSRVMARLDEHTDHVLVHTGQNYAHGLSDVFFEEMGLRRPDHHLEAVGKSLADTLGRVIARADEVFEKEQPDALLVLGDTNSALSVIPAKRRHIPIFHMEAGNRCFDQRVPEETNRKIVDHVSDVNMTYSEHARRYLLAEGLPPDRVIKTGSPMKEVLTHYADAIDRSGALEQLSLERGGYFVASLHREENVDAPERLERLVQTLDAVVAAHDCPLVLSVHPRTRARLDAAGLGFDARVKALPAMGFFDYVALQKHAKCVLSDSGTITEESSICGFPAVTVREAHERPEGMDEGVLVMTGLDAGRVLEAVALTIRQFREVGPMRLPADYDVDRVSWQVVKIILGYTDYVKRVVWRA